MFPPLLFTFWCLLQFDICNSFLQIDRCWTAYPTNLLRVFICFIYENLSSWIIFQLWMNPFFSRLIVKLLFYTPSTKCSLINCTSFVNIYQKYWFQFFDMFPRHRLINTIIRLNEFLRYLQILLDIFVWFFGIL